MGICSTLIYTASRLYFLIILLIFRVVNHFKTRGSVPAPRDPLLLISATEAVRRISKRKLTSSQLVASYTYRIEQVNDVINAVVLKFYKEAAMKAEEIDKSIAAMDDHQLEELTRSKPLLGVPFTVKDSFEVDGQVITCGIYAQKGIKRTNTAEVIKRMEAAGAILIAVTNVPEACYWVETSNGIYGQTKNPYDTRRAVGGSSGGEGALISSAGSLIGIGSDIGGSIRIPSFMNGIFGMKTTPGVIPLDGHVPVVKGYPEKMLRVGPMCRYVEDIPRLIEVMGGEKVPELRLSDPVDFSKARFYYMEGIQIPTIQSLSCEMKSALLKTVSHFETKFNVEAIRVDLPLVEKAVEILLSSLDTEGEPRIGDYLVSLEGNKGRLNWKVEIPKFFMGKSVHTPGALFTCMFDDLDRISAKDKAEFLLLRDRLIRQVAELLGNDGILLFPSWPQTAPFHHQTVFTPFNLAYTGLFNALALPVIQCPTGMDRNGLPLGVQVVGSPNADRLLVAAAKEISHAFGGWNAPWSQ